MKIVRGIVADIKDMHSMWKDCSSWLVQLEGLPVKLVATDPPDIGVGDRVTLAGEKKTDGLWAYAYRNDSRKSEGALPNQKFFLWACYLS